MESKLSSKEEQRQRKERIQEKVRQENRTRTSQKKKKKLPDILIWHENSRRGSSVDLEKPWDPIRKMKLM